MHAISTLRYDAASGKEVPYYRLKESYRDVHGHVHSLILLNIGFEPTLTPRQVHRIAEFPSDRFENRDTLSLFGRRTAWDYYNLIREIEATNRQLKTDLNLRPIYHQKDSRSDAHLFFGLLSYWVVNTIRHQLKLSGETAYWTEIVRRMQPQKLVTTQAVNTLGEKVRFRARSRPTKEAEAIYRALGMRPAPFIKVKICSTQEPPG